MMQKFPGAAWQGTGQHSQPSSTASHDIEIYCLCSRYSTKHLGQYFFKCLALPAYNIFFHLKRQRNKLLWTHNFMLIVVMLQNSLHCILEGSHFVCVLVELLDTSIGGHQMATVWEEIWNDHCKFQCITP